jgi:hypothetical protein
LRFISILFGSIFLSGCGLIECIDTQIERKPIPIDKKLLFDLSIVDQPDTSIEVVCEKFYDSMCAERGNYWSIRQTGLKSSFGSSSVKLKNDNETSYELEFPHCKKLVTDKEITLKDTRIVWGREKVKVEAFGENGKIESWLGKSFRYLSSQGAVHKYKYGGYKGAPLEIIEFEFSIYLNGQLISGNQE